MTKKALQSITHDAEGNAFYWIIGTPEKRPGAKKTDFIIWFRGYDFAGLKKAWEYLRKSAAPEDEVYGWKNTSEDPEGISAAMTA